MRTAIQVVVLSVLYFAFQTPGIAHPVSASDTIPKINISPVELNFGQVAIGQSKELSLVISNVSDTALKLLTVADSVLAAPFAVDSGSGSFSLDSGRSRRIYILFHPYQVGGSLDSIVITSNTDSAHKRVVIYMLGSGFIPDTIARISVTPLVIDYGVVYTGQSKPLTFKISNVTNTNLKLSGTVLNAHLPFFVTVGLGNFLIDSGRSNTVIVQFAPSDTGTYRDSVIINSNTDNATKRIVVYLRAVVRSSDELKPQISIRSFTIDFGQSTVNTSADEQQTFSIKNVSDSERTLTVNMLFPRDPFSISGTADHLVLARYESQYVTVHFMPLVVGNYFDSIIVISDAPQSRIPIYLKAQVIATGSVKDNAGSGVVSVVTYPNPVTNTLFIQLQAAIASRVICSFFDITGRQVLATNPEQIESGLNTIRIDISALPPGIYQGRIEGLESEKMFTVVINQ
ncbi:MAG TPA: choice-of-anchor D domain-containing protein [Candidatus Kapabacteria bacterium]|nr:choice-of-anchor D domain-containing protein [Candidatus Kapabacteria bacterium]